MCTICILIYCDSGVKLETALDTVSWYAGKVEVVRYLEEINKDKKVCVLTTDSNSSNIELVESLY